jgi:hypothetical protein
MDGLSFFVVDITAVDGIGYEHYMLVKFAILPRLIAEAEAKAEVIDKAKKTRQHLCADYKRNPFSLLQDLCIYVSFQQR